MIPRVRVWGILVALACTACIEPFDGVKMEVLFRNIQVPGGEPMVVNGETITPGGRPPQGAHYEMYFVAGERADRPFHLVSFQATPIVDAAHPCFIELDDAEYPVYGGDEVPAGLHRTAWYEKLRELYLADGEVTGAEAGALADAREREEEMGLLANLTAIVVHPFGPGVSSAEHAEFQDALAELEARLPDPTATDPAANAARFELCQSMFERFPAWYVGSDRLISLPINGRYIGVEDGTDPRNDGYVGGGDLTLDASIPEDFTALWVTWQFDDPADPRADGFGGHRPTGYLYMGGDPIVRTRGVLNVPLLHPVFPSINAEAAIFTGLDDDGLNF